MNLEQWILEHQQCDEEIALAEKHLSDLKAKKNAIPLVDDHGQGIQLESHVELMEEEEYFLKNPDQLSGLKADGKKEVEGGLVLTAILIGAAISIVIISDYSVWIIGVAFIFAALSILTIAGTIQGFKRLKKAKRIEEMSKQKSDQKNVKDALKATLSKAALKKQIKT